MSSNLKVNTILPSTGTTIGIGTVGGLINVVGNIDVNSTSGISTFNGLEISGIVTAKAGAAVTYYGDGSNLTGITSPAITSIGSDGAARVLTSDGDGTATAHSFVTIESSRLSVNRGSGSGAFPLIVRRTDASGIIAEFANSSGYGLLIGQNSATGEAYLRTGTGQPLVFTTNSGSGIANERVRIDSAGRIGIGENSPTRDIVIKRSGSVQVSMVGATNQNIFLNFGDTDDDNIGGVYYDNTNNRMIIRANTNDAVQVKSNGNMAVNDGDLEIGTSGHGISFAATGDSAGNQGSSELLDDYEEGSWTPAFKAGSNATACPTTVNEAKYTRVGRLVTATAYFTMNSYASGTTNGDTRIVGLPYANLGDHGGAVIHYWAGLNANVTFMSGTVQGSSSEVLIRGTNSASTSTTNLDFDAHFGPGDSLILTAIYHAST